MKKIIDDVFNIIIEENDLRKQAQTLADIRDILFIDFKEEYLLKNQKFDFSFSFAKENKQSLRFSYNNFEEKKEFPGKLKKIFTLFGGKFDIGVLTELLERTGSVSEKFQTTLGLEWEQGKSTPRFKLYFEELFNFYTPSERRRLLGKIANCIDFDISSIDAGHSIGAIAVDFMPEGGYDLKVYDFYPVISRSQLDKYLNDFKIRTSDGLVDAFYNELDKEKRAFNYLTYRMNDEELKSIKLYKIYEVQQINDFRGAFNEVANFLRRIKSGNREEIRRISQLCRANSVMLFPVIASIDFSSADAYKFDIYLSIK